MNLEQYKKEALRTMSKCESPLLDDFHMVSGMVTESAEIMDVYKKHIAYGKPLDLVNIKEEIGDLMWYISNMCNIHDWNLEDILTTNIEKLKTRYPEKFTNENALNRDLIKERKILEKDEITIHDENLTGEQYFSFIPDELKERFKDCTIEIYNKKEY